METFSSRKLYNFEKPWKFLTSQKLFSFGWLTLRSTNSKERDDTHQWKSDHLQVQILIYKNHILNPTRTRLKFQIRAIDYLQSVLKFSYLQTSFNISLFFLLCLDTEKFLSNRDLPIISNGLKFLHK